jgi:hypothetical protein
MLEIQDIDLGQAQQYDGIKLVKMGSQPFPE